MAKKREKRIRIDEGNRKSKRKDEKKKDRKRGGRGMMRKTLFVV